MAQPMTVGRAMTITVGVIFVVAVAWLLFKLHEILILLLLGILFATAIEPLVHQLRRRGLARGQAIATVYAVLAAIIGVTLYLVVPSLAHQVSGLVKGIPGILDRLEVQARNSNSSFINTTGVQAVQHARTTYADIKANPSINGSTAFGLVTSVFGALFSIISVLIIAFYWMTEKAIIKRVVLGLVPLAKRDRAHSLWDEIENRLGGWTRGQLMLCAIMAVVSAVAYFALQLPFWLPLALWSGVTELIPYIGPILGGGAAVMVGLSVSWQKGVLVLAVALVLQQLEGHVLVPRVMSSAVGMTPLTVVLAVFSGERLLGTLGAVLAVPIGAAVQVALQELLRSYRDEPDSPAIGPVHAAVAATDGASMTPEGVRSYVEGERAAR